MWCSPISVGVRQSVVGPAATASSVDRTGVIEAWHRLILSFFRARLEAKASRRARVDTFRNVAARLCSRDRAPS